MTTLKTGWPICGKCCEVAYFSWIGGAHHCAVAEPEEALDESPPRVEAFEPTDRGWPGCVRSQAARYVDTDKRGLHYLLWRVIDNAVDEAVAGYATTIQVNLRDDGGVSVVDDGRGIPLAESEPFVPTTVALTTTTPPERDPSDEYGDFGGTRAVGAWIVNALSTRMEVIAIRDDYTYVRTYECAVPGSLYREETAEAAMTFVRFWPDPAIFGTATYDSMTVAHRLRQLALLNSGVTFELIDERPAAEHRVRTFCTTDGLTGYVKRINRFRPSIHENVIHFCGRSAAGQVEVAMQWSAGYSDNVHTFVNNIDTSLDRGAHDDGFRAALVNVVSRYAKEHKLLRETEPDFSSDDIREGLAAAVSIRLAEPVFDDHATAQLTNPDVRVAVQQLCEHNLTRWFATNPAGAEAITDKAIRAADDSRMPRRCSGRG